MSNWRHLMKKKKKDIFRLQFEEQYACGLGDILLPVYACSGSKKHSQGYSGMIFISCTPKS